MGFPWAAIPFAPGVAPAALVAAPAQGRWLVAASETGFNIGDEIPASSVPAGATNSRMMQNIPHNQTKYSIFSKESKNTPFICINIQYVKIILYTVSNYCKSFQG